MAAKIFPLAALVCTVLCGCGGGGDTAPAQDCKTSVRVQMFGDSTQVAAHRWGYLQAEMDSTYGKGRVKLVLQAVSGTSSHQLVTGTDGLNTPWPQSVDADIAIVNHGINDQAFRTPMDEYRANLGKFSSGPVHMVIETPNPVHTVALPNDEWAKAGREAAGGATLADVHSYVMSIPSWQSYITDGLHPSMLLQQMIAHNVTAPALRPLIDSIICQ